ncbi:MAG: hypothetical protein ABGY41_04915 [Candidatus Poribacteria bacterium]
MADITPRIGRLMVGRGSRPLARQRASDGPRGRRRFTAVWRAARTVRVGGTTAGGGQLLSVYGLADMLGVPPKTVYGWWYAKSIPA